MQSRTMKPQQAVRANGRLSSIGRMKKASIFGLALVLCGIAGVLIRTKFDAVFPESPGRVWTKIPQVQPDDAAPPLRAAIEPVINPETVPPPPVERVSSPAWPPNAVMADAWRNRGALSASEALETLFWAKEGADVEILVALIDFDVFTESDLQEAANCFAAIRHDKRIALGISRVEEFIALAWAVSGKARFNGALFVSAKSIGADDVELRVQLFGTTDALGSASFAGNHPFVFHRTVEGWQWRMLPHQISATRDSWKIMVGMSPFAQASRSPARR